MNPPNIPTRRIFLTQAAAASAALATMNFASVAQAQAAAPDKPAEKKPIPASGPYIVGPLPGYSPYIGTLVSQLTYIQGAVTGPVKGMTQADLDYLFDADSNSIGALLLHLAATETYYGMNTFQNMKWDTWPADIKKKWDPAMELGDSGRKEIKGHDLAWYLDIMKETREHTLAEFKKKDDDWLIRGDTPQFDGPEVTNNYWKWFHVTEHESHHSGQISWLAKRLPSAKNKPKSEGL